MTGLRDDQALVKALVKWTKLAPSPLAKAAGLTPTTITRPFNGTATTRISVPTFEKLKARWPDFPGWAHPEADAPPSVNDDSSVQVERLPTFAGMGGGGTGDGDAGTLAFSRSLVETELRANAGDLLAIRAEGNSMEPDFKGGDLILIDRRRRTLASPGVFCLWDSDGYVIKYLSRVAGSDPPRVRVVSYRSDVVEPYERLVEECDIQGRVVWFGRQVQ